MLRNSNTCYYVKKDLFLLLNGRFCPIFHSQVLNSFAGAAWFTTGLFCFGYLPDSWANDQRLCLTQEGVLEGAVGDSGFKGSLLVAKKPGGVDNWLYDSGNVVDSFPTVSFGLFLNKYKIHLRDWYLFKLPI